MSEALSQVGSSQTAKVKGRKIPEHLIREVIDGNAFYYPDFRAILNKSKTLEEVMADSSLQWILKEGIGDKVKAQLDKKRYRFGRGEVGVHLGPNSNLGLDMAIFDSDQLPKAEISGNYVEIAPIAVIEIDVQVETLDRNVNVFEDYVLPKIQKLMDFGTQRLVWIFSRSQKVLIAEAGKNWYFAEWDQDIEIMEGVMFNVVAILEEEA